jgi:hypothetical protein
MSKQEGLSPSKGMSARKGWNKEEAQNLPTKMIPLHDLRNHPGKACAGPPLRKQTGFEYFFFGITLFSEPGKQSPRNPQKESWLV